MNPRKTHSDVLFQACLGFEGLSPCPKVPLRKLYRVALPPTPFVSPCRDGACPVSLGCGGRRGKPRLYGMSWFRSGKMLPSLHLQPQTKIMISLNDIQSALGRIRNSIYLS